MADITFDQLIDEQKKTTSSLNRLGTTLREQLLGDKSQEKDQRRVDAGNKAWQTRQTNIAEAGKKVGETAGDEDVEQKSILGRMLDKLNFLGKGTESAAQKKEGAKDEQSFLGKTFGKLGDTFKDGFKGMMGILGKFKTTAMTGLMAFLTAAGLFALIAFLQSKHWKKIREWIKENPLTGVLAAIIAITAILFPVKTFKAIRWALGKFTKIFTTLFKFLEWGGKHLKDFTKARLAGGPMKSMTALKNGMKSIGDFFGKISKSFQAWVKSGSKIGKVVGDVVKWVGKIFKTVTTVGSKFAGFASGIARFAGPLGIIITLAMAMWETIKSMKDRFKETGSWLETIQTGLATFIGNILGFIPDLIKGAISWIFEKLGSIFGIESFTNISEFLDSFSFIDLITQGYEKIFDLIEAGWNALVDFDYAGTFVKIKDIMIEKFGLIKDGISGAVTTLVTKITDFFKNLIKNVMALILKHPLVKAFKAAKGFFSGDKTDEEEFLETEKERLKEGGEFTGGGLIFGSDRNEAGLTIEEQAAKNLEDFKTRQAAEQTEQVDYTPEMDKTTPVEASTLNNRIAELESKIAMARSMGTVDGEMLGPTAENIKRLEQKKAELEAAKSGGGGGNITNIAQNNSSSVNQQRTTFQSKSMIDLETSQVVAPGP